MAVRRTCRATRRARSPKPEGNRVVKAKVSDFSAGMFQGRGRQPPAQILTPNLVADDDPDQDRYAVNACKDGTKGLDCLGLRSPSRAGEEMDTRSRLQAILAWV